MAILYTKQYYQRKLTELQGYSGVLQTHLTILNDLLNGIKEFSFDKHREDHEENLRSLIRKVESVKVRTDKMIKLYDQTIEELDFGDKIIYENVDFMGKTLKNLVDL